MPQDTYYTASDPESAFLRAIIANPDDDAPRLMYADWLTKTGGPGGEFIRIQCRLAEMPEDDPLRPALEDREADLWQQHAPRRTSWLPRTRGVI